MIDFLFRRFLLLLYAFLGPSAGRIYSTGSCGIINYTLVHAKGEAFPNKYAAGDMVLNIGKRLPFFFTPALTRLYRKGYPVEFIWYLIVAANRVLFHIAILYFGFALTSDPWLAVLIWAALIYSHEAQGALHMTFFSMNDPYYGSQAIPLGLMTVAFIVQGWFIPAALFAAILIYAYAPLALGIVAALMVSLLMGEASAIEKATALSLFTITIIPFVGKVFNLLTAASRKAMAHHRFHERHWYLFRHWSVHFFIEKHIQEGYGFFFLALFGIALLWPQGVERLTDPVSALSALVGFLAAMSLFLVNLYTFRNMTAVNSHAMRASLLVKPLLFGLVITGLVVLFDAGVGLAGWIGALLLFISLRVYGSRSPYDWWGEPRMRMAVGGELAALAGWLLITWEVEGVSFLLHAGGFAFVAAAVLTPALLALMSYSSGSVMATFSGLINLYDDCTWLMRARAINVFNVVVALALGVALFFRPSIPLVVTPPTGALLYGIASLLAVAMVGLGIRWALWENTRSRIRLFRNDVWYGMNAMKMIGVPQFIDGAAVWSRLHSQEGALFVCDPASLRFVFFRHWGERSLWTIVNEVIGCAYDPAEFIRGSDRYHDAGGRILCGRRPNITFDSDRFYLRSEADWLSFAQKTGCRYLMSNRHLEKRRWSFPIAYANEGVAIYDMGVQEGNPHA